MTFRIVKATADHAEDIAPRLREADRLEVLAGGREPRAALMRSLELSDFAYTAVCDGRPETMFGCGTSCMLSKTGAPWLMGSDVMPGHYRYFLRGSKAWVEEMRQRYSRLANYVDARHSASIRWLSWLGFEIGEPQPFGPLQKPFRLFSMDGY